MFDGGVEIRGKASMKEERLKMGAEEPSSGHFCLNSIFAAIHMALLWVPVWCPSSLD